MVAFIHGGYWQAIYNLTHAGHLCVDLAAHGVASWNLEYRRIGDPGGLWPAPLDDALAALGCLRELGRQFPLDLERVILAGHSAGGQLSLLAATRADIPIRAVVSLAGVVDLAATRATGDDNGMIERLLGGSPDEMPDRWTEASPRAQLPLGIRYVLACGTADVHWASNDEMTAAARASGDEAELLALPGAGHFELVDPQADEWGVVRAKLLELFR